MARHVARISTGLASVALVACAALSPLLSGGQVDAKKGHHHDPKPPKPPIVQDRAPLAHFLVPPSRTGGSGNDPNRRRDEQ